MVKLPKAHLTTDVLVIGGGAAGLTAALEARRKGVEVTVISKSKVGRSGNTIISGTGMAILALDPESEDSLEIYRGDTLRSGKDVNDRDMLELYLTGSPKIIDKLTEYGVVLRKLDSRLMRKQAPGHSVPRSFTTDFGSYPYVTRGLSLTLPLLKSCEKSGVKIIDFAPVVELARIRDRVCGAVAIQKKSQSVLIIRAGVVILAAGGGGGVYARSNNTRDMTGDAYGLAYDVGAALRDMEFVQFYPTMMFSPIKVTISSPLFGEGAFLRNAENERFMQRYDAAGDMATRDIVTRAMFNEVMEGRGVQGNVYMDCRHLKETVLRTKFPELLRLLAKVDIDPLKDLIPISPATHFFMGGVAVNQKCETSVPGLLACGESVGGLHGANRLGGNALSETFVFGMIAGNHAADIAAAMEKTEASVFEPLPFHSGTQSIAEIKKSLKRSVWKHLSIIRNEKSCLEAIDAIDQVSASLEDAALESVHDLVSVYETKQMMTAARLIARGALLRKESRGAHFRSDYPNTEQQFRGSYYLKNDRGNTDVAFHPVKE